MNPIIILLYVVCLILLFILLIPKTKNTKMVSILQDENMACEGREVTCRKKDGDGYQCCPHDSPVCCSEQGCCPKNYSCCANGKACCPPEAPVCCFGFEDEDSEQPTWLCVDSETTCQERKIKH